MSDSVSNAKKTIMAEIEALRAMLSRLDSRFQDAVDVIMATNGRVVVVGMGKSGIIGKKIAATLASTGTPAFFVHPGEAFHGDLGMINPADVILLISNSGETEEILRIIPFLQHQGNIVISMTGCEKSTLAINSNITLDIHVEREACNINLAPTSSTTVALVLGDALAVSLSIAKEFQPEDFARFHPGGNLGKRLLTKVSDVMRKTNLPICDSLTTFKDVVQTINRGRLGLAIVTNGKSLLGIITDGDVRRTFDNQDINSVKALDIMTLNPKIVRPSDRFTDAEALMLSSKINSLIVINEINEVVGILQIYDIN